MRTRCRCHRDDRDVRPRCHFSRIWRSSFSSSGAARNYSSRVAVAREHRVVVAVAAGRL
jgi:hypothetical protein